MNLSMFLRIPFHRALQFFFLLLIILVLPSCGKSNQANVPPPAPVVQGTYPAAPSQPLMSPEQTINSQMLAQIQLVKNHYSCQTPSPRLDFKYFIPNVPAGANIPQSALQDFPTSGTISKVYMGIFPTYNDLLIVMDVAQGPNVIGRGIIISLCQFNPLIIPERPLSITMATALNVTENSSCVVGNAKGDFFLNAPQYQAYPAFPAPMRNVFINFPVCQAQAQH